jgi:predicted DNA binding protein
MVVLVELSIPSESFDLGAVTDTPGTVRVELDRVVPSGEGVMPFVWVEADDPQAFEAAVRESDLVDELYALARVGSRVLYQVVWLDAAKGFANTLAASGATVVEARGTDDWWFRLRFPDHAGVRAFHDRCRADRIAFDVDRIYTLDDDAGDAYAFDLTDEQHAALLAAVERGYFEVPRGVTLGEVAADLGISQQAASERVRRGANAVLRSVLLEDLRGRDRDAGSSTNAEP